MADRVGIGIIGTGFARRVQIPSFLRCEGAYIASVASARIENARSVAAEFGITHATDDWRETIGAPGVDLVVITTPPNLHREMTIAALEADKHVLCEKPMAMDVAECEEMVAEVSRPGPLALIDHELRFLPGRQKALRMLRDGAIGCVRHAKALFRSPSRIDASLEWDWWSDAAAGGGALGAIGSHVIDTLQWFLGTPISAVSCQLHANIKQRRDASGSLREVTTDDEANMLVRFADGDLVDDATGLISISMVEQPGYLNRTEFYGTEGAMRIDHLGEVYTLRNGESDWTRVETDLGDPLPGVFDNGFPRGFLQFAPVIVDAVRHGLTEIPRAATFADGLAIQRVLDAARRSDAEGRTVRL